MQINLIRIFLVTLTAFAHQGPIRRDETPTTYAWTPINPAEDCISDICGPPPRSNLYLSQYEDRIRQYNLAAVKNPADVEYPPALAKDIEELRNLHLKDINTIYERFKKSSSLGAEPPNAMGKAFYNLSYATPYLAKIKYKPAFVNGKQGTVIDEVASGAALGDLSETDQAWIFKTANFLANQSTKSPISDDDVQSHPAALLLTELHPDVSVEQALKTETSQARGLLAIMTNLSSIDRIVFFQNTTPDRLALIAKHADDGSIDEDETRELIQWNRDTTVLNAYFKTPGSPFLTRPTPVVEDIIKSDGGVDKVAERFRQMQIHDQQASDFKLQSCKLQYFVNKGLLPSREQANILNKDITRAKQMIEAMIKEKFPVNMQLTLVQTVENAKFVVPPTAADFENSFSNTIKARLEEERSTVRTTQDMTGAEIRGIVPMLGSTDSSSSAEPDPSNEFCDAYKYKPMSDGNYTTLGRILLSYTTATGEESSRLKAIAHELGHSISKAISDNPDFQKQIAGVRRCITQEHAPSSPAGLGDVGPNAEEDFADTVAGESGVSVSGRNSWCQFLNLTPDRQQYAEASMQSDASDPHSSGLFRLLDFERMRKGNLPESCLKYFSAEHVADHLTSCFDLAKPSNDPGSADATR